MSIRLLKSAIAVTALAATPLVAAAAPASAAPLSQCDAAMFKKVGSGWTVFVPSEWSCYDKL
ncbi:hypothetical protein ACFVWG_03400 [Kribbella sp. NPDC058245]|uniref:hypothetical protein n=1 Tax=Kribbella sp. NPDC058245 TaxID=3346399 RepID=UPI0036F10BE3